ncbi:conserved hypothetical protein, membrane or secreted [Candidatus Magnetomorum sp. HK-1]|nr:conserved hypothetical protein, membrane or secreted [Candidatus Magnetomorum sp. HK-1]
MNKKVITFFLLVLLLITSSLKITYAKFTDPISFIKIETDALINTFIQDKDGFFWIGSVNGLYKYDGYTFKQYEAGPDSIVNCYVTSLFEDSEGLIWIGTPTGVSVYNKKTDTFTTFVHDPGDPGSLSNNNINDTKIQSIHEDINGMIWIGTENGLNKFNKTTQSFTRYQDIFVDNDIWSIYVDKNQFLWIGSVNGLPWRLYSKNTRLKQ